MTCRHVKWVPCHHDMAHPHVAGRGDGLQIWKVAVNILNKQSRTADRGWPSSLGIGRGANNPHRKTLYLLRSMCKGLGNGAWLGECRLDPVGSGQGPVAGSSEYGDEPSGSGATELIIVTCCLV
jgi:hypothetical protein